MMGLDVSVVDDTVVGTIAAVVPDPTGSGIVVSAPASVRASRVVDVVGVVCVVDVVGVVDVA